MMPDLSGRASSASMVSESVLDFVLRARDSSVLFPLHCELVQGPATAAYARRREADDVLVSASEPDVEAGAFQYAEELSA